MRRATWILWLMLALLPLRSWAVAGMGLPQAVQDVAVSVAMVDEAAQPEPVMPCHQADEASDVGSNCEVCDWCHAAMSTPPATVELGKPPIADAPIVAPQRDTGRPAIGGLERPPRSPAA